MNMASCHLRRHRIPSCPEGAAQKACIITVTGTRNRSRSPAAIRARYPTSTLSPPATASTPENGTAMVASGTPRLAA